MGVSRQFPGYAVRIIDAFLAVPQYLAMAKGTDDERRKLTFLIIGQLVHFDKSFGWCWKSADPGRPPSKDALAVRVGETLLAWDWQSGASRLRQVTEGQEAEDITGQNYIAVAPLDTLGLDAPGEPGEPTKPPIDLKPLTERIARLEALAVRQAEVNQNLTELARSLHDSLQRLTDQYIADLTRIDGYLKSRPIPTGVQVTARLYGFNVPVSSRLVFDDPAH